MSKIVKKVFAVCMAFIMVLTLAEGFFHVARAYEPFRPFFTYSTDITVRRENFTEFFDLNNPMGPLGTPLSYDPSTGILILTPDQPRMVGSTTLAPRINMNADFNLQADVFLGDKIHIAGGGDGIGFAFHPNHTRDMGNFGNGLGIAGLPNGIGFKLDTFFNPVAEPSLGTHPDPNVGGIRQFGAFVITDGVFIRNVPDTRPGAVPGTNRRQYGWAHVYTDSVQAVPELTNSQWHGLEIDYVAATRIMTVILTHRPSEGVDGQVLVWTKNIDPIVSYAQNVLGVESFGFSISASTGDNTNLHKFRLEEFRYEARSGVLEARYFAIDYPDIMIAGIERHENVVEVPEQTA